MEARVTGAFVPRALNPTPSLVLSAKQAQKPTLPMLLLHAGTRSWTSSAIRLRSGAVPNTSLRQDLPEQRLQSAEAPCQGDVGGGCHSYGFIIDSCIVSQIMPE